MKHRNYSLSPETLSYLRHLQGQGRAAAAPDGDVERWRAT